MHIILHSPLKPEQCLAAFPQLQQRFPVFSEIWRECRLPTLLLTVETSTDAWYLALDFKPGHELLLSVELASEPLEPNPMRQALQQLRDWLVILEPGTFVKRHTLGQLRPGEPC